MNNLLKEEYFHIGTDKIKKELWTNIYMEQIYKSYIKPLGGLWTSHKNEHTICDWIGYKLDQDNPDDLERLKFIKACLIKFKETSKFLILKTKNDYKNLKDSGFILNLEEPIEINKWEEIIITNELIDYEKLSKFYDLMYISPYANPSLINYSIMTMYALNPDCIEYYKPIDINVEKLTTTKKGEKIYIKEPSKDYYNLITYIKKLFDEKTKKIIYTTYKEYINKINIIIKELEIEINSYKIPYLENNPDKIWIIKTILKNLYIEDYNKTKTLLLKK